MLLVGQQEWHPACKKIEWWDAGMVICLGRGADLHTAQLMPLPLTISCSSKSRLVLPSRLYLSGTSSSDSPGQSPGGPKMVSSSVLVFIAIKCTVFELEACDRQMDRQINKVQHAALHNNLPPTDSELSRMNCCHSTPILHSLHWRPCHCRAGKLVVQIC